MPFAVILSQGDEIVTGQLVDTNAVWLAERLTELGFDVLEHVSLRDCTDEIAQALVRAAGQAAFVICTGGLGPTQDDLTAQAVAQAFHRPLQLDDIALEQIGQMYTRNNRVMPAVNQKQAWLPAGSTRLDNMWGTAPGFAVEHGGSTLVFVPGVPSEMRQMWAHRVVGLIAQRFDLKAGALVTVRTAGAGESNLQECIGAFEEPDVALSFRTMVTENHIKLRFSAQTPPARIDAVVHDIVQRIGAPVFAVERPGEPQGSLSATVGRLLVERGQTVSTAESCTGGLIASWLTRNPGASAWFTDGVVTYSNASKVRLLGVPQAELDQFGAVSEPVACSMARGCLQRSGSSWALSSTGIAGPGGGTDDKPVGTVHIALVGPEGQVHHRLLRLRGDRTRIQALTAGAALDLLRRALHNDL